MLGNNRRRRPQQLYVAAAALVAPLAVAGWAVAANGAAGKGGGALPVAAAPAAPQPHQPGQPAASGGAESVGDLGALLNEDVVTTASKVAETSTTAPGIVVSISGRDMTRLGFRSVSEALNYLGYGVYNDDDRTTSTVGAHGVTLATEGRHVLVLLNGHIMNEQLGGRQMLNPALGVPVESIDHIEVVLGPGSVLYGSNAVLGVVNVVTSRAHNAAGARVFAQTSFSPAMDQGRNLAGGALGYRPRVGFVLGYELPLLGIPLEVMATAELQYQRGQDVTFGPQTLAPRAFGTPPVWAGVGSTDFAAPSGVVDVRWGPWRAMFQGNSYRVDDPLAGALFRADGSRAIGRLSYSAARLDISREDQLSRIFSTKTRLYGDYVSWSQNSTFADAESCAPGQTAGCINRRETKSIWTGVESQLSASWLDSGALGTMLGVDMRVRKSSSDLAYDSLDPTLTTASTPIPSKFDVTNMLGAVYLQQLWQPTNWLNVNAGARLDVDQVFGSRLSPRLALVASPTSSTTAKAVYSEAFRAPTPLEVNFFDPTRQLKPLGDLQAETVRSLDGQLVQKVGELSLGLSGYYSWYEGLIDLRAVTEADARAARAQGLAYGTADFKKFVRFENLGSVQAKGTIFTASYSTMARLEVAASFGIGEATLEYAQLQRVSGITPQPAPSLAERRLERQPTWMGGVRGAYKFDDHLVLSLASAFYGNRLTYNTLDPVTVSAGVQEIRLSPYSLSDQLELRGGLSGKLIGPLNYTAAMEYRFNGRGTTLLASELQQTGTGQTNSYEFNPVDRLTAVVGLDVAF